MSSSHQLMVIPLEAQRASKDNEVNVLSIVENFSQEGNFGFLFVVYVSTTLGRETLCCHVGMKKKRMVIVY